jgi:hypothetical protein
MNGTGIENKYRTLMHRLNRGYKPLKQFSHEKSRDRYSLFSAGDLCHADQLALQPLYHLAYYRLDILADLFDLPITYGSSVSWIVEGYSAFLF